MCNKIKQSIAALCNRRIKSTFFLGLLTALQLCGFGFCNRKDALYSWFESPKTLAEQLNNTVNISLLDKGRILHTAVKNALETRDFTPLKLVLQRIESDISSQKNAHYQNHFPNSFDTKGMTPFGLAVKAGDKVLVDHLASTRFIDVNTASDKETSLLIALEEEYLNLAQHLWYDIPDIAVANINFTTPNKTTGETPLHISIRKGFTHLAKAFIEALIDEKNSDALLAKDHLGMTPLDTAAEYSTKDLFTLLFRQIIQPYNTASEPSKIREILFRPHADKNSKYSLFALAYLPERFEMSWKRISKFGSTTDHHLKMFRHVLEQVKNYLTPQDAQDIRAEIHRLERRNEISGDYPKKLHEIVNSVFPIVASLATNSDLTVQEND